MPANAKEDPNAIGTLTLVLSVVVVMFMKHRSIIHYGVWYDL
jgi:hypothetical protein